MTDQKRLEEIKRQWHEEDTLDFNAYEWLIQQAEEKIQLEKVNAELRASIIGWENQFGDLEQENQCYKQALEDVKYKYVSLAPYGAEVQRDAMLEVVNEARQALKGDSNG